MAHFARLDDSNIVTNVIVIGNDDIIKTPQAWWDPFKLFTGKESEEVGIALCRSICEDPDSKWVQTSWNARNGEGFRGNYAGIGMTYMTNVKTLGVESTDIFVRQQPYDSWSIGISTADWFPPNGVEPIAIYDLSNEERMAGKYVEWDEELYQSDNTKGWSIFDKTKPFPNDGPKIRRKDV